MVPLWKLKGYRLISALFLLTAFGVWALGGLNNLHILLALAGVCNALWALYHRPENEDPLIGRVSGNFSSRGTETGRMASSHPNSSNYPKAE